MRHNIITVLQKVCAFFWKSTCSFFAYFLQSRWNCVAAIGVMYFLCVNFSWRTFLFRGEDMKKLSKALFIFFSIGILGALLVISAFAEIYTGSCGTNVNYKLDTSTGLLEITGSGYMSNYFVNSSHLFLILQIL